MTASKEIGFLLEARDMKTIVVAVDFSNGTELVLSSAVKMAKALGEVIHLVHVVDDTPLYTMYGMYPEEIPAMNEYRELANEGAKRRLEDARVKVAESGVSVSTEILEGKPQDAIVEYVAKVESEMVIVGTHGHSAIGSVLMGSVASGLVRQSEVPVLVVPCNAK